MASVHICVKPTFRRNVVGVNLLDAQQDAAASSPGVSPTIAEYLTSYALSVARIMTSNPALNKVPS
eukprot:1860634-Prorocentrum_lima.AAC.1